MKLLTALGLYFLPFLNNTNELSINYENVKISFIEGKDTEGTIAGFKALISFDENNLADSFISGTVDVNTINTGITGRDKHLKSADYFDAEKFPLMAFRSTLIKATENGFEVKGLLKIKDIEREEKITFNFSNNLFEGNMTIYLAHYKIGKYATIDPEYTPVKIFFSIPVY